MNQLKNGAMPTTSQINVGRYLEFFRSYAEKQIPVLYVAFSSGLSGSYSSALQAVELLKEEYEDPEIYVFDTKAASIGEGLLVLEAARLKKEGKSIEETLEWLEKNYLKVHSWVTVDDLKYLERIVNETVKTIVAPLDQIVYVAYAGDLESAEKAKRLLEEQIKMKDVKLYPLGPTIASHTGYGCIAIFSMGISR